MLQAMGRDQTRVLICAAASLVLIVVATLVMDWYRVAFDAGDELNRVAIAIDLRTLRTCTAVRLCTTTPLGPLPGMFPTLAAVTLWSSLGFAALVGFQAGVRLLTGNANDAIAKLGYMFALTTISIAVATAYLFGPETEGPSIQLATNMGVALHRTWAPATLIVGLIAGFATLYMAVAPESSSDLGDTYKPVTLVNVRPPPGERPPTEHPGDRPATNRPPTERPADRPATDRPSADRAVARSTQIPAAARAATRPLRPTGRTGAQPPPSEASPRTDEPLPEAFQAIAARSNEQTQPEIVGRQRSNVQTHPTGRTPAAGVRAKPPSGGNPAVTASPVAAAPGSGPVPRATGAQGAPGTGPVPRATSAPGAPRPATGQPGPVRRTTAPLASQRPVTGQHPPTRRPPLDDRSAREALEPAPGTRRATTGQVPAASPATTGPLPGTRRATTGQVPAASPATTGRIPLIGPATITSQVPRLERETLEHTPTGMGERAKSGLIPVPEHLRKRLSYVAITAELTGGGIDARREDGTSRLVLWRDVVGVVVRRMPPVFDDALFVDIVSTARSTLRIVPWTRLTGDPIEGEGDARPVKVVEYILAKCPKAKLDPATRQFLETGEPARLPDLETLRAHDARLA
jgi:hypothetical protein